MPPKPATVSQPARKKARATAAQTPRIMPAPLLTSAQSALPVSASPALPDNPPARSDDAGVRAYERWSREEERALVDWLTDLTNYERWKSAGQAAGPENATKKTSGETKIAVARAISLHISTACKKERIDGQKLKLKIQWFEQRYKAANDWLNNTGAGIEPDLDRAGRLQSNKIKDVLIKMFPYFYDLDPVFSLRASFQPPYVKETGVEAVSAQEIMYPGADGTDADIDDSADADPQTPPAQPSSSSSTATKQTASPDEDHRSHADKRLEGDASSDSDGEISARHIKEINGPQKKTLKKPPAAKATMSFSETLMHLDKGRSSRLEKKMESTNMRAMEKSALERKRLELQEKQLEGEAEERKIRLIEAENRRMELRLRGQGLGSKWHQRQCLRMSGSCLTRNK
ncbi:uncharacterized protein LOC129590673 isoform X3 [Paramacrobiotus metropolitanus]|uniref:uncharacterized protein LOC129590673 isoform X3 n=1 Tax=Paramacrobiotus metropolitanus TaxID=2943436 RepID=UPI002446118D|nr:uncharacterized protein LOC129590673 isoform X3 [Paramacrobiotus metropolitanus]